MKMEVPRRIRTEDYSTDEASIIGKLSVVINPFMDSVYRILNGRVDYENLNQQLLDVVVTMDGTGKVINPPKIKTTVAGRIRAGIVVNSVNVKNPTVFPVSAPFINFTHSDNAITILNVGGLQPNSEYRLTILFSA